MCKILKYILFGFIMYDEILGDVEFEYDYCKSRGIPVSLESLEADWWDFLEGMMRVCPSKERRKLHEYGFYVGRVFLELSSRKGFK